RRSGSDICIVRRENYREWSAGLERSEARQRPAVLEQVRIRKHESMTMVEAGQCPFRPDVAHILRNIRFGKRRADVRGIIDRLRPRVICIEAQSTAQMLFDLDGPGVIDRVSVPADHLESAQLWIRSSCIDRAGPRRRDILKRTVVRA